MRTIAPELLILLVLALMGGLVLVAVGAAQWVAASAIARRVRSRRDRRSRRQQIREMRAARWEPRTLNEGNIAWVQVMLITESGEVLGNDGTTVRVNRNDEEALLEAQIDAQMRADEANGELPLA